MSEYIKKLSETVATQYATVFLNEYLGDMIFLGSDIELVLSEKAALIYQEVDDPAYFGAAIHILDKSIIAINTKQALRTRYYSAAHELWHLQFESGAIPLANCDGFDHERAADHFAAKVLLPASLIRNLMNNLKDEIETLVIKVADLASMPYVAVTRRLKELGKRVPKEFSQRSEQDWIIARGELGFPPSVLDKADTFVQFSALSKNVERKVANGQINLETATSLLKHVNPEQAKSYWQQREQLITDWDLEDE